MAGEEWRPSAVLACPPAEAPPHASVQAPTNQGPRKTTVEEAWPPEPWTEGLGFSWLVCLHVGSEHVCVPLVLFGNDLLELQNLVSL